MSPYYVTSTGTYDITGTGNYSKIYIYDIGSSTTATTSVTTLPVGTSITQWSSDAGNEPPRAWQTKLYAGQTVELPDGSRLEIDGSGNYRILDDDAQVTYKANWNREFNRFINASDLLEDFIRDLGVAGIRQGEVLGVPIEVFINWLIHRAAEADGDPVPVGVPRLEDRSQSYKHPRCRRCGRFIKAALASDKLQFCSGDHYQQYVNRLGEQPTALLET